MIVIGDLNPPLQMLIREFDSATHEDSERANQIKTGAEFIAARLKAGSSTDLIFICTHNSRRSQFAHVWSMISAALHGLVNVRSYSGGTEVTACNKRTVASLARFGFDVNDTTGGSNPTYSVKYSSVLPSIECDSKLFADIEASDFAAMMCCSDVDEKCPVVNGAAIRIPWHYDDPKVADDTADEETRYDERSRQIGQDMHHMMRLAVVLTTTERIIP